jgi:DNA-binding winged helix-turn-helix (wHTH) protein/TolB-like protein
MPREIKRLYKFGEFELDPAQRLLLREGRIVQLTPKAVDLLLALVASGGRVVSKEDLLQRVWPDSFVEEANLSHNIYKLREALGDNADGEQYIETLPRRGYRFVTTVQEVGDDGDVIIEEHSRSHIVVQESVVPSAIDNAPQALPVNRKPAPRTLWMVVTVVIIASAAVTWWTFSRRNPTTTSASIRSIAVLPFKPLAADSRDEGLELGMADTLIMRLSSMPQVTVRPLSAVRKYMSLEQDATEAGRQLQVDAVLEGTVQKSGNRVRVTARLLRLSDGTQLWADKFDQRFSDVFALQDSIAERVAGRMSQKLSSGENFWSRRGTGNAEAYQFYTRGRYYWSTFRPEQIGDSIKYFKSAIEKDPNYALAYAGLADAYALAGIYGPLTVQEAYPRSRAAALHALQLDDSLADAHQTLGAVKLLGDWDWQGAAAELRRAIPIICLLMLSMATISRLWAGPQMLSARYSVPSKLTRNGRTPMKT